MGHPVALGVGQDPGVYSIRCIDVFTMGRPLETREMATEPREGTQHDAPCQMVMVHFKISRRAVGSNKSND